MEIVLIKYFPAAGFAQEDWFLLGVLINRWKTSLYVILFGLLLDESGVVFKFDIALLRLQIKMLEIISWWEVASIS